MFPEATLRCRLFKLSRLYMVALWQFFIRVKLFYLSNDTELCVHPLLIILAALISEILKLVINMQ